jgi:nucleotide-binding universal stress UspA family protein
MKTMKPIIVGIDGSQAAIGAALWSVDEAISRGAPLRLVSVIARAHRSPDDDDRDLALADQSLRQARSAIEATGKPVTVETDVPRGPAAAVLVEASRDAELIVVGSVGAGRDDRFTLGPTATEVAERARCPVAVLRTDSGPPPPDIDWIVVRMADAPDNDAVVKHAVAEAKLRRAPMLLLAGPPEELAEHADGDFERRVHEWRRRHPEVRVYPIATQDAVAGFLTAHEERVQLAVIGGVEAARLARLVGPQGHPLFRHPECSVLVVR